MPPAATSSPESAERVPRIFLIGLAALVAYVLLAGGLSNLLIMWFPTGSDSGDYALSHFPALVVLVAAGIVFVRWSGWSSQVWRTPAAVETQPRRWWMLGFPALLLVQAVILFALTPWGDRTIGLVIMVLAATALVGVGEELYVRGILRASLRAHHGETVTLIVTCLLFGAAHALGSTLMGLPIAFIALQVGATALDGAFYYGALRATGRLWVPMSLHALTDAALYLSNDQLGDKSGSGVSTSSANIWIEVTLWVLSAVLLISCIRQDRRARAGRQSAEVS